MEKTVIRKDIIPAILLFLLLFLTTILLDFLLHSYNQVWIGKYLGIPGITILLFSFAYSLRKRNIILVSSPRFLLKVHQYFAWFGTLLVLVHAGIHFNSIIPWIALVLMLSVFVSGLTGRYILGKAKKTLKQRYTYLEDQGFTVEEIDRKIFLDALSVKAMAKWKVVHKPIALIFVVFMGLHITTIFMFWSW